MTTPVDYDREGVRAALNELPRGPEGVRGPYDVAVAYMKECGSPRLTDADYWTTERLDGLVANLRPRLEKAGYLAFHPLIRTEGLVARAQALPPDLNDWASDQAKLAEVPHTKRANLWTHEHWAAVDAILSAAEDLAAERAERVERALADVGMGGVDVMSHMVGVVTHGRTDELAELTAPESDYMVEFADLMEADATEGATIAPISVDWTAEAKRRGIKAAEMLAEVKAVAKDLQIEAPKGSSLKALDGWYDPRVVAKVLAQSPDVAEETVTEVVNAEPAEAEHSLEEELAAPLTTPAWTMPYDVAELVAELTATRDHLTAILEKLTS